MTRTATRLAAVAVALAAVFAAAGCGSDAEPLPPQTVGEGVEPNGRVVRIVDGDTLIADVEGTEDRVRLIGIDTPESVIPDTPAECFGVEASAHLSDLIPEGTAIRIERDVEARDRFDRLLAYVYRASDGLFVNLAMARDGYAATLSIPPNITYADAFTAAVAEARSAERGLWSAC